MTLNQIKDAMAGPAYDFLRTDPNLGSHIVLLALGGSHAYGTNTEDSDIDLRGCAVSRTEVLLGLSRFEQVKDVTTDTTVYSLPKLVDMLLKGNSGVVDMLGCKQEHYLVLTDIGKELIDNRKAFLSMHTADSFRGNARLQLRRFERALKEDSRFQERKREQAVNELRAIPWEQALSPDDVIEFQKGREGKILASIEISRHPIEEVQKILFCISSVTETYKKLKSGTRVVDAPHLNKHAMHVVRLYLTGADLLEQGDIITPREEHHELLMSIRRGHYLNPDGTYRREFFDLVSSLERRLDYAMRNTCLPPAPDMEWAQDFLISANRQTLEMEGFFSKKGEDADSSRKQVTDIAARCR